MYKTAASIKINSLELKNIDLGEVACSSSGNNCEHRPSGRCFENMLQYAKLESENGIQPE
jgi:hypothetical protein